MFQLRLFLRKWSLHQDVLRQRCLCSQNAKADAKLRCPNHINLLMSLHQDITVLLMHMHLVHLQKSKTMYMSFAILLVANFFAASLI